MTPARTTKPMGNEILIMAVRNFVTYCYRHLGKDEPALGKMGDHVGFNAITIRCEIQVFQYL